MHKSISKHVRVGPGGMKCSCCFPPPGKRKEVFRSVKRKLKRTAFNVEYCELNAIEKE